MVWDSIVASYYALAVILVLTAIVGLIVVAVMDSASGEPRRLAEQH